MARATKRRGIDEKNVSPKTIEIEPLDRPAAKGILETGPAPKIGMKPVNKSAALAVIEQADTRELYTKYARALVTALGDPIVALASVMGKTYEEMQAENWWVLHKELVTAGAASVSEQELLRLLGGDRGIRSAALVDIMFNAKDPGDSVRAIAELNKMDDDASDMEGERYEDWARLILDEQEAEG